MGGGRPGEQRRGGLVLRLPDSGLVLQICPVLYHAGTVLLNSLLDTVPGESGWGLELGPGIEGSCVLLSYSVSESPLPGPAMELSWVQRCH